METHSLQRVWLSWCWVCCTNTRLKERLLAPQELSQRIIWGSELNNDVFPSTYLSAWIFNSSWIIWADQRSSSTHIRRTSLTASWTRFETQFLLSSRSGNEPMNLIPLLRAVSRSEFCWVLIDTRSLCSLIRFIRRCLRIIHYRAPKLPEGSGHKPLHE